MNADSQDSRPSRGRRVLGWMWRHPKWSVVLALVVAGIIGAAAGSSQQQQTGSTGNASSAAPVQTRAPEKPQQSEAEKKLAEDKRHSRRACEHFRNVMGDVRDGVLTDAELRKKLKEVHGNASIGTAQVQDAAREMLAAITQDDSDSLIEATKQMDAACKAAGH